MTEDDLRDLYQEVILDHGRRPRNFRRLDAPDASARGNNPLCGDRLEVFVRMGSDGRIADAAFEGKGCAISTASASLMTELVKGKTMEQADALFHTFHEMMTDESHGHAHPEPNQDDLDTLKVLAGVNQFPMRVKCATLAWHTMEAALADKGETTTE